MLWVSMDDSAELLLRLGEGQTLCISVVYLLVKEDRNSLDKVDNWDILIVDVN